MSQLVDGRIPAHTECPYKEPCVVRGGMKCHHKGVEHQVPFSCGLARAYEMVSKPKPRYQNQDSSNATKDAQ